MRRRPVIDRFEDIAMPEPNSGCWLWTGRIDGQGYGRIWAGGRNSLAHRVSFELFCAPIPAGLHIDHKCCVRSCVNPDHLDVVTQAENMNRAALRGRMVSPNSFKTHCKHGHPFAERHLYLSPTGARVCRTCATARKRKSKRHNAHR